MRTYAKFILFIAIAIVLIGGLLLATGRLSIPRDFSSPPTSIRVVAQSGAPMDGIEVGRIWYDGDCKTDGSETITTGPGGTAHFQKIPANVGLFTGAWRKIYTGFGPCGSGSGTRTEIYVRFPGRYDVLPQGKPLHAVGQHGVQQDPNGVWYSARPDSQSNTLVSLTFPSKAKSIDYVLSAKPQSQ